MGPGIKAALHKSCGHVPGWLSPSQFLSDPGRFPSLVLDPRKPAAGGFRGMVSAGHFFLFLFLLLLPWLLQQLFGFCPLLGSREESLAQSPASPCPRDPPWDASDPAPRPSHTRGTAFPTSAPPHLLPVLRRPRVPQRQGAAPSPRHGPHTVGILPTGAEGHEASTARTNLSLRGEGRFSARDGYSQRTWL